MCDPEKHFELIVPHRSRWCPPLRNAILASAARHISRVQNPTSSPEHVYYWEGHAIPDLNEETALHYHSEGIKELLKRSMDPDEIREENLLAAAIILRFYEEIDAPLREGARDNELFLQVMNVFIDAQIPAVPLVPHSSPMITGPKIGGIPSPEHHYPQIQSPTASDPTFPTSSIVEGVTGGRWRSDGLCQASFWVAFRQEIHTTVLKQRPFNLALSRCEAFRSFAAAEDAVWADRLIIFCADVLEFCYGNTASNHTEQDSNLTVKERWLKLKACEKMWSTVLPASFEPIFLRNPERDRKEVFPQICYMADCHVAGVQHLEIAKILLAVHDPTRPKLGPRHIASVRALSAELKGSVLRLCGIALSNRRTPPGLVTAFLGIVMCGDHFEDALEQDALLGLLDELEHAHAWPLGGAREALKESWGWHDDGTEVMLGGQD